jgi:hypothetical protein
MARREQRNAIAASAFITAQGGDRQMDGVLVFAGVAVLLTLRLRTAHRRRQLDRAYAEALSRAARQAKLSTFKVVLAVVLIAAIWLWLRAH